MFWVLENVKPAEASVSYWLFSTNHFLTISWRLLLIDKIAKGTGGEGSHPLGCGNPSTGDQDPTWCHLQVLCGIALGSSIHSCILIPVRNNKCKKMVNSLWNYEEISILQKNLKATDFQFTSRFSNVRIVWSIFKFGRGVCFFLEWQQLYISLFCLCLAHYSGKYTSR